MNICETIFQQLSLSNIENKLNLIDLTYYPLATNNEIDEMVELNIMKNNVPCNTKFECISDELKHIINIKFGVSKEISKYITMKNNLATCRMKYDEYYMIISYKNEPRRIKIFDFIIYNQNVNCIINYIYVNKIWFQTKLLINNRNYKTCRFDDMDKNQIEKQHKSSIDAIIDLLKN